MAKKPGLHRPPRVPTRLRARLRGIPGDCTLVDLSLQGLAIETRSALAPGDRVKVELYDMDGFPVAEASAEVVHVGGAQSGIRAGMRLLPANGDPVLSMLLREVLSSPERAGRRGHPRARLHIPAVARKEGLELEVLDVAMGGMGFTEVNPVGLPAAVKPGARATLELVYADASMRSLGAEVAWCLRGGESCGAFGTKFVYLPDGARHAIMRLISGEEVPAEVRVNLIV